MEDLFKNYPDVVSVKGMMEMLNIGELLAYRLVRLKLIPSRKIGREYKISKAAITEYLLPNENIRGGNLT